MKLLHIDSSILGDHSVSRRISAAAAARIVALNPGIEVVYRDLAADPLPHQSGALFAALAMPPEARDPSAQQALDELGAALEDFLAADVVVIGAPMYNFGIPSQLKVWIDALAVKGKTFRYTEAGPEGLAGGKRVIVASSKGGFYGEGSPAAFLDHQDAYLKGVFGFMGIRDLEFVTAEGVNVSEEQKTAALEGAVASAGALKAA